jgi:hypothetical protein
VIFTNLTYQKIFMLTNDLSRISLLIIGLYFSSLMPIGHAKGDESARQKAFSLMSKGRAKFDDEKYIDAIQLWRQAYDTYQDNKLLLFIASTYSRVTDACKDEEKAWTAYLSACKEGACPNKKRGLTRHQQFKSRCYITVTIDSSAPKATVSYQGRQWGTLPHKRDLLMDQYTKIKISAPGYLSKYIDLKLDDPSLKKSTPTGGETKPVNKTEIKVLLNVIPPESFFEKHQLKMALTTAIVGVSILSIGSLQLSSASTLSDEVSNRIYPDEYETLAGKQADMAQYQADQDRFKSNQVWGAVLLTAGVITIGTGVWMLLYQGPNKVLFERARKQGDMASRSNSNRDASDHHIEWSIKPMGSSQRLVDGV